MCTSTRGESFRVFQSSHSPRHPSLLFVSIPNTAPTRVCLSAWYRAVVLCGGETTRVLVGVLPSLAPTARLSISPPRNTVSVTYHVHITTIRGGALDISKKQACPPPQVPTRDHRGAPSTPKQYTNSTARAHASIHHQTTSRCQRVPAGRVSQLSHAAG